jgi:hypothetical protein
MNYRDSGCARMTVSEVGQPVLKFPVDRLWLAVQTGLRKTRSARRCWSVEEKKMDQVERLMQRPKLYNNIDGVGELGMGFMLLCFALLEWLQINSPASAIWHRVYVLFL